MLPPADPLEHRRSEEAEEQAEKHPAGLPVQIRAVVAAELHGADQFSGRIHWIEPVLKLPSKDEAQAHEEDERTDALDWQRPAKSVDEFQVEFPETREPSWSSKALSMPRANVGDSCAMPAVFTM